MDVQGHAGVTVVIHGHHKGLQGQADPVRYMDVTEGSRAKLGCPV
jgi:hypothetical protein